MSRVISSLDPWSYPVAIHWGGGITKLDFVGNRYMVQGQDQELADVLGEATRGMTQAQQLAYRTSVGLDLREPDSVFHLPVNPRRAFLKNKVNPPTKKDPGALNEFLYLGGTIVTEIDLVDVRGEFAKVGSDIGPYPVVHELLTHFRTDAGDNWQFFQIATPLEVVTTGAEPAKMATGTWTWSLNESETFWVAHNSYMDPGGGYEPGDAPPPPPPYSVQFYGGALSIEYDRDTGQPEQPPTETVTWEARPAYEGEIDFDATHNITAFEETWFDQIVWGRMVGATPDTQYGNDESPITNGALPGQWGRMRIAVTVTKGALAASVNGSNPVVVRANPLFPIPLVPPIDPETGKPRAYFPIEDATGPYSSGRKTYEIMMNFSGIVRCMWLYRKPKNLTELKSLSVVRPLTPPDHPAWKRT